ncbi:DUF7509 family protein [Halomarina pelagica]|uniref:DUF7509 family protein n=1 Tax=Halomarina pelagica TaxID=2961599 RepID=UPI0020C29A87|nr:hypothetical protein [Halomarina sp. BND7]
MREVLLERLPAPAFADFLVYLMGPYTTFELDYVLAPETESEHLKADLGAFTAADRAFIAELEALCSELRADPGVNAFIATDPAIPLPEDENATADTPTMNAIAQSKAFAEASNAVGFILPIAGVRDGVSAEIGAVLEAMDLENDDPSPPVKDPRRFRIFVETGITSTTIHATEDEYSVPIVEYETKGQLRKELHDFVTDVATLEATGILPSVQDELTRDHV